MLHARVCSLNLQSLYSSKRKRACFTCMQAVDGRPLVVRVRSEGPPKPSDRPRYGHVEDENAKLYVSFMPPHLDDEALKQMFSQFGEVASCRIIMDRETGKSKGYGFISMDSAASAAAAISGLDGYLTPGATKPMSVKIAENRQAGGRLGQFGRGGPGETPRILSSPPPSPSGPPC